MNKGFTLLELLIVIIIISILASVGFSRYGDIVERGRSSEARYICARIRDLVEMYHAENGAFPSITDLDLGAIPTGVDTNYDCGTSSTHFFKYHLDTFTLENYYQVVALRCTSGGKLPEASHHYRLKLMVDRDASSCEWLDFTGS